MNKTELVKKFRKKYNVTMALANEYVSGVFDIMKDGIVADGVFAFPEFGRLSTQKVAERTQVSPLQDGKIITVPEHFRMRFKPYPALKDQINQ